MWIKYSIGIWYGKVTYADRVQLSAIAEERSTVDGEKYINI